MKIGIRQADTPTH